MLNNFGTGWKTLFEKHIEYAVSVLPDVYVESVQRYKGMLRITFKSSNEHLQYILNCFSYKMERESAKTCEKCGKYGHRIFDERLDEPMCMCLDCYVLTVDSIISQ